MEAICKWYSVIFLLTEICISIKMLIKEEVLERRQNYFVIMLAQIPVLMYVISH